MSHYQQQEFDFIKRTRKILKQYEDFAIAKEERYEITLLLNCMVGLLILPQQHWFNNLPEEIISSEAWGIEPEDIRYIRKGEDKSVANISTHLRNSISHYRFNAISEAEGDITSVTFKDYTDSSKKNLTFDATLSVSSIRTFTEKLTDTLIEKMTQANS